MYFRSAHTLLSTYTFSIYVIFINIYSNSVPFSGGTEYCAVLFSFFEAYMNCASTF